MSFIGRVRSIFASQATLKEGFNKLQKDVAGVLSRSEKYLDRIETLISHTDDLAGLVYDEGQDYYGEDYLSQKLNSKSKALLNDIKHEIYPDVFDLPEMLRKLELEVGYLYSELKREAGEVNDPEKMKAIRHYFPEIKPKG